MRRIGVRVLAFLVVAIAAFALWSGLAMAGSAATSTGGAEDSTGSVTRSQLIQTEETPDAEETPNRRDCPRHQNDGDDETETTETSTAV